MYTDYVEDKFSMDENKIRDKKEREETAAKRQTEHLFIYFIRTTTENYPRKI